MKLQHEYHDATLSAIRVSGDELTLVVDLDGHWNNKCEQRAYLMFHNVKNLDDVCAILSIASEDGDFSCTDEIIGILKTDKARYLDDLDKAGSIEIDCRGLSEI